ncbi:MAG: hypothetical protein AAGC55_11215 [Myxococcota bacterium]
MRATIRKLRRALVTIAGGLALVVCVSVGCNAVDEFLDTDDAPPSGVDCYSSFESFKGAMRRAGKQLPRDQEWHHIVNQNPTNTRRFPKRLHCTDNLIALPTNIHRQVSGHYSSKQDWSRPKTVREVVSAMSWDEQHTYGLRLLRRYRITP